MEVEELWHRIAKNSASSISSSSQAVVLDSAKWVDDLEIRFTSDYRLLIGSSTNAQFQVTTEINLLTEPLIRDSAIKSSVFVSSSSAQAQPWHVGLQTLHEKDVEFPPIACQCENGLFLILYLVSKGSADLSKHEERKVANTAFLDIDDTDIEAEEEDDEGMSVILSGDSSDSESAISAEAIELVTSCECQNHPAENHLNRGKDCIHPMSRSVITDSTSTLTVSPRSFYFDIYSLLNFPLACLSDLVITDWHVEPNGSSTYTFHLLCARRGLIMSVNSSSNARYYALKILKRQGLAGWNWHVSRQHLNLPMTSHTLHPAGIVVSSNALVLLKSHTTIALVEADVVQKLGSKSKSSSTKKSRDIISMSQLSPSAWNAILPTSSPLSSSSQPESTVSENPEILDKCYRTVVEVAAGEPVDLETSRGVHSGYRIVVVGVSNLSLLPGLHQLDSSTFILNLMPNQLKPSSTFVDSVYQTRYTTKTNVQLLFITAPPYRLRIVPTRDWRALSSHALKEALKELETLSPTDDDDDISKQNEMIMLLQAAEKRTTSVPKFISDSLAGTRRDDAIAPLPLTAVDLDEMINLKKHKDDGLIGVCHIDGVDYAVRICTHAMQVELPIQQKDLNTYLIESEGNLISLTPLPTTITVDGTDKPCRWEACSVGPVHVCSTLEDSYLTSFASAETLDPRIEESSVMWKNGINGWGNTITMSKERRRRVWNTELSVGFLLDPHEEVECIHTIRMTAEECYTCVGTMPVSNGLYPDVGRLLIFANDNVSEPCFSMNVVEGVREINEIVFNDKRLLWFSGGARVWVREIHSGGQLKGGTFLNCFSHITDVNVIEGAYFAIGTEQHGVTFAALQLSTNRRSPAAGSSQFTPLLFLPLARCHVQRPLAHTVCGFVARSNQVAVIGGDFHGNLWSYKFVIPLAAKGMMEEDDGSWRELKPVSEQRPLRILGGIRLAFQESLGNGEYAFWVVNHSNQLARLTWEDFFGSDD